MAAGDGCAEVVSELSRPDMGDWLPAGQSTFTGVKSARRPEFVDLASATQSLVKRWYDGSPPQALRAVRVSRLSTSSDPGLAIATSIATNPFRPAGERFISRNVSRFNRRAVPWRMAAST